MNREERCTLYMIMAGVLLYITVLSVPVLIFTADRLRCEMGLIIGGLLACAMAWHMSHALNRVMYMEKHHTAYMVCSSVGRLLCAAGVIVLIAWAGLADAVFMAAGILGLKFGAYFEPILEKRLKIKNKQ